MEVPPCDRSALATSLPPFLPEDPIAYHMKFKHLEICGTAKQVKIEEGKSYRYRQAEGYIHSSQPCR
jgi:hypothetical protein